MRRSDGWPPWLIFYRFIIISVVTKKNFFHDASKRQNGVDVAYYFVKECPFFLSKNFPWQLKTLSMGLQIIRYQILHIAKKAWRHFSASHQLTSLSFGRPLFIDRSDVHPSIPGWTTGALFFYPRGKGARGRGCNLLRGKDIVISWCTTLFSIL